MKANTPYTPEQIKDIAREAFEASGMTQADVAEHLGISQPSVARALQGASNLHSVRIRIIEATTPYRVEGPEYRLVKR